MTESQQPEQKAHHVYDDIEEHDNHLPNWWLAILYGSIVFALGYWFVYQTTGVAQNPTEEYRAEIAEMMKQKAARAGALTEDSLQALAKDAAVVAEGQKTFVQMCAPCHLPTGQGLVGPNLTDAYAIHGHAALDVHQSIAKGFLDKGMPGWEQSLGDKRVKELVAFVLTLRNTNVAGGKAPQGKDEQGNEAPGGAAPPAPAPAPAPGAPPPPGEAAPPAAVPQPG